MILTRFFSRRCRLLFLALVFSLAAVGAHAKELNLEVKLLWASNESKSPKKEHEPVDEATAAKLRKHFPQWKYFFVEKKLVGLVPSRGSNKFTLSKECTIEITELEGHQRNHQRLLVRLHGRRQARKRVDRRRHPTRRKVAGARVAVPGDLSKETSIGSALSTPACFH